MSNIGLLESALVLFLIVVFIEWLRLRGAGPTLVLQDFRLQPEQTQGEFLCVRGRQAGIAAWVMSKFGLQPLTLLSVSDLEVSRDTMGPSGFHTLYAPLSEISASSCGYYRAFGVLVLSLGFYAFGLGTLLLAVLANSNDYARLTAVGGAKTVLWACAACGTACYVWYALSKRVLISVITHGDVSIGIAFKRSFIENAGLELKRAVEAVDVINGRILENKRDAGE